MLTLKKRIAFWVWMVSVLLFFGFSSTGYAWWLSTHKQMTYEALKSLAGEERAQNIAAFSNDPDLWPYYRDQPPYDYGHRIKDYMLTKGMGEGLGRPGAEEGAAYWAQRAHEAYQKHPNAKEWQMYLGYACHFLADAMCPPHCTERDRYNEAQDSHGEFENTYDPIPSEFMPSLIGSPELDLIFQEREFFLDCTAIENWTIEQAHKVRDMGPPEEEQRYSSLLGYYDDNEIKKIMTNIGAGIKGLYAFVVGRQSLITTLSPYKIESPRATALVIDHSGSMGSEGKLQKAQEAARCYIDSVPDEEWASVAAFSSSGHQVVELLPIKTGKEQLKRGAFSLSSSGNTNIGAGLDVGLNQLFSAGVEPKEPIILLLSDGMHNTGELWPSVEKCRQKKVKVYTVAFGSDADQGTLCKIAYQTGGRCSPAGLRNLSHVYHKINNQVHNISTLFSCNDFLKPGQSLNYKVQVDPNIKNLIFFSNWQGSEVQMVITEPSGEKIIPEEADNRYKKGETYSIFEVESQPGSWQVELTGSELPPEGEQINFSVSGKSDLYTNVLTFQPEYSRGQNVLIAIEVTELHDSEKVPLKDVAVKAEIQRPSTKIYKMIKAGQVDLGVLLRELHLRKTSIRLYDDGNHQDIQSGDGIFANITSNIDINGPYLVTFTIESQKQNGEVIKRKITETFQVGPIEKNELTISDIMKLLLSSVPRDQHKLPNISPKSQKYLDDLLKRLGR